MRQKRLKFILRLLSVYHGGHIGIGQPGMRAHNRLIEGILAEVARLGHKHLADKAQPVHVGIQGAKAVGELLRQHRHHIIGKINGVASFGCLGIQRGIRPDIVGHIGNGHPQPEASVLPAAVHRIVEVPGILAVNGYQREIPNIAAVLLVAFRHLIRNIPGLLNNFSAELMRNAAPEHRELDLHVQLSQIPQHPGGSDLKGFRAFSLRDIADHHGSHNGISKVGGRRKNKMAVAKAGIVRC